MSTVSALRGWLAALAFAFWMGGFTFYAAVVIPTAHEVLGSHLEVGFITRQVTWWLNWAAVPALALLLWRLIAARADASTRSRRALAISLAAMTLAQLALFVLHPRLDAMLDSGAQSIMHRARFYSAHRIYLLVSAAQWLAAVAHAWFWARSLAFSPQRASASA